MRLRQALNRPWLAPASGLALLVACVLALEWAGHAGWISAFFLPPPSEIALAGWRLGDEEPLGAAFMTTLMLTLSATAASAALGITAGWLMYRYGDFGRAYEAWVGALFSAPLILLYPLFLVLFGRNLFTVALMGFLAGVIPVVLKTFEGLRGVPRVLINVARSFNLDERGILFKVLLPAARPAVFTGLRLSFIYCTINIVGLEYLTNFGGLGFLVGRMYDRFDIPAMYATVAFVLLVSVLGFWAAERIERLFTRR